MRKSTIHKSAVVVHIADPVREERIAGTCPAIVERREIFATPCQATAPSIMLPTYQAGVAKWQTHRT
jgi:hypothetical protein